MDKPRITPWEANGTFCKGCTLNSVPGLMRPRHALAPVSGPPAEFQNGHGKNNNRHVQWPGSKTREKKESARACGLWLQDGVAGLRFSQLGLWP